MNITLNGTKITQDSKNLAFEKNSGVDEIVITVDTDESWSYKLDVKYPDKYNVENDALYNVIDLNRNGDICSVILTSGMLPFNGKYTMQLRGISGDKVYHSDTFEVWVKYSIEPGSTYNPVPSEFYQVEARLDDKVDEAKKYAENAETASTRMPKISPDNTWLIWDVETGNYVDTGVKASGGGSGMSSTERSTLIAVVNAIGAFNVNNGQELIDAFMDAWVVKIPATRITLSVASLRFTAGISQSLTATVEPSDSTDTVVWSSSNSAVATVSNGVVTPVANGDCIITATAGSVSASCSVNVAFAEEVVYYSITNNLTNCTSNNSKASIVEGGSYTATLTADDGYTLDGASVSIVVNGVDVTDIAYSGGVVTIQSVTGNVVIAVEAVSTEIESIVYLDYVTLSGGAYFDTGIVASMENKYLIGVMTPEISETQYIWGTKARNNTNLDASDYYDDVISIYNTRKFSRTVKSSEHYFDIYDSTSMNGINGSDNKLNLVPWYVYMQFDASAVKAYADEEMTSPLGASKFIVGNLSSNHFQYALNYSAFGNEITPFDTTKHAPSNVYLGKVNNTLGAFADYATPVDGIKYYVYKVWDKNGNLLMHLKPAKKGTKVGMYDVISSAFLESAEGTVTAGNEVSA